jgi:hypothetical protein
MINGIEIGTELTIHYPTITHVRHLVEAPRKPRRIIVRSIRDMVAVPLTIKEYLQRPFVARSRYLVFAHEVDTSSFRQFYLGSSQEFASPGMLRIGYSERKPSQPRFIARPFGATLQERKLLMRYISQRPVEEWESLRIFVDDLRVVSY